MHYTLHRLIHSFSAMHNQHIEHVTHLRRPYSIAANRLLWSIYKLQCIVVLFTASLLMFGHISLCYFAYNCVKQWLTGHPTKLNSKVQSIVILCIGM